MTQIDYKKVFSKLSHIKALSHDQKFDQIVQNLITLTLNQKKDKNPKNETELSLRINETYGISIRTPIIISNLDKLLSLGEVTKDRVTKELNVTSTVYERIKQRLEYCSNLELNVKTKWIEELGNSNTEITDEIKGVIWNCLQSYLCSVFEQHGIQTLHLLNPSAKIQDEDQKSLIATIESISKEFNVPKEILIFSINKFINDADLDRTNYISQLADSTFTSFALTSDAETVSFLNQRYNNLQLFLDTNFIFGILDLHKNNEDASAREILEEVKKNRLPFKLAYHPETLAEFRRAFDARALHIRASKWTRESSRVALTVDGLSPLEELFHKQNIENEIDTSVFLDKYDHVDLILKDLGLMEYVPKTFTSDDEYVEIENDIQKYQKFYESIPNRKPKSYSGFKHDVVVVREVRSLNPRKTKFLESNAFFISSDYILSKFERINYKRNWEINYVVSPSVFLQLIRPFIENDYSSNKRFVETFSIPELRAFEIDYSTTRSKALQILNDSYHDTTFETKVKILRDQVILEKLEKANDDFSAQVEIIENQIAVENQILSKQNADALKSIEEIKKEKEKIENEKINALHGKSVEIDNIKNEFNLENIRQQISHKKELLRITEKSIQNDIKRYVPIERAIEKRLKNHRFLLSLLPVAFFTIIAFLIYQLGWDLMGPITYVLGLLFLVMGYLYLIIKGDSFDPRKYFNYYRKAIGSSVYNDFNYDITERDLHLDTKKKLTDEINNLEYELNKNA